MTTRTGCSTPDNRRRGAELQTGYAQRARHARKEGGEAATRKKKNEAPWVARYKPRATQHEA